MNNMPKDKEIRRAFAQNLLEGWRSLSPEQQLETLDRRLGKGQGAKKQRARIHALLASGAK
jgi:hypothetical protein